MSNVSEVNFDLIHRAANKHKALESLLGILYGISADKTLNALEIVFLDTWLKENTFLQRNPDAIDILDCTGDILKKNIITAEEIEDLFNLIANVLEYRTTDRNSDSDKASANILTGIIQGITADSKIVEQEIFSLNQWLKNSAATAWPAPIINDRLKKILADGTITSDEKENLKTLLFSLGANKLTKTGSVTGLTATFGTTTPEKLIITGKLFCFTGTFIYGNRAVCENLVLELGGKTVRSITQKTDYLILGEFPSRDWITSSYGLKIQSALELKNKGRGIELLTEETWFNLIKNAQ